MLVIAVGNVFRGDDGAGPQAAARVRTLDLPRVTVVDALGDVGLIDLWTGHDHVILLDAVRSGAAPGTVIHRDLVAAPLPRELVSPLFPSAWSRGRGGARPDDGAVCRTRLVFIGIEGEHFESGVGLSPRVDRRARRRGAAGGTRNAGRKTSRRWTRYAGVDFAYAAHLPSLLHRLVLAVATSTVIAQRGAG